MTEKTGLRSRRFAAFAVAALALAFLWVGISRADAQVPGTDDACTRLAGTTRFGTAATVARSFAPTGSRVAIVASGREFPDALAAAGLARTLGAPVLLVEPPGQSEELPTATRTALDDLGVEEVVIVGGTDAVSADLQQRLAQRYPTVRRVAAAGRAGTAAAIAAEAGTPGEIDGRRTAIVATGDNYPDALTGAPVAFAGDSSGPFPVLLTQGSTVPAPTREALAALEIEQVVVLGGTDAVPAATESELEAITGRDVIRLAGSTREATAATVAEFAVTQLGFEREAVLLADGRRMYPSPDALAGGPLGGRIGAPILLVNPGLPAPTSDFLARHAEDIAQVAALGGEAAVDRSTKDSGCRAAGVQSGPESETADTTTPPAGGGGGGGGGGGAPDGGGPPDPGDEPGPGGVGPDVVRAVAPVDMTAGDGRDGLVSEGDLWRLLFDEPVELADGATVQVRDRDGDVATVRCADVPSGVGEASCSLNRSDVGLGVMVHGPGRMLTVTIGGPSGAVVPADGGTGDGVLAYPVEIVGQSGVTSVADGLPWLPLDDPDNVIEVDWDAADVYAIGPGIVGGEYGNRGLDGEPDTIVTTWREPVVPFGGGGYDPAQFAFDAGCRSWPLSSMEPAIGVTQTGERVLVVEFADGTLADASSLDCIAYADDDSSSPDTGDVVDLDGDPAGYLSHRIYNPDA